MMRASHLPTAYYSNVSNLTFSGFIYANVYLFGITNLVIPLLHMFVHLIIHYIIILLCYMGQTCNFVFMCSLPIIPTLTAILIHLYHNLFLLNHRRHSIKVGEGGQSTAVLTLWILTKYLKHLTFKWDDSTYVYMVRSKLTTNAHIFHIQNILLYNRPFLHASVNLDVVKIYKIGSKIQNTAAQWLC